MCFESNTTTSAMFPSFTSRVTGGIQSLDSQVLVAGEWRNKICIWDFFFSQDCVWVLCRDRTVKFALTRVGALYTAVPMCTPFSLH